MWVWLLKVFYIDRVHRHLLMMFARGIEPYELPEYEINNDSLGNDQTEVLNDSLIVT